MRDGRRALAIAEQLVAEDGGGQWRSLATLAAAQAEIGSFEEAVRTVGKAHALLREQLEIARKEGRDLAGLLSGQQLLESALQTFRSQKPYRTPR